MFTKLRKSMVALLAGAAIVATPFAVPVVASAATDPAATNTTDIQSCVSQGVNLSTAGNGASCTPGDDQTGSQKIQDIVTTVVNIFSIVVGIISVIMIIYGGFKYITSGGDSGNVTSAKNTIIFAVIGLVIVALAQFVVQFVLSKVSTSGNA